MKDVKIIEDKENALFSRREVRLTVVADSTPSKADAEKVVVEQTKAKEGAVAVKNVLGKFGSNSFTIVAFVYDSKELKESIEPKKKETKSK